MLTDPTKQTTATVDAPAPASNGLKALTTPASPAAGATPPKPTGLGAALKSAPASAPGLNDSVADKVKALTSQDSPLMQQAKTDGLKLANRRGLLNSSMAAGASQEATIRAATPIAQQDASQAFQKNMQASDQAWRSGESALDRDLQTGMQDKQIGSTEALAKAQRELQEKMQTADIDAQRQAQLRDIASREGMAAAERALQDLMQGRDITSREGMANADRTSNEAIQQANRDLEERMQGTALSAQEKQQLREIASREGLANAERQFSAWQNDINRQTQINLDREGRQTQREMQEREIATDAAQRQLDRSLQEQIASWNLKASDRNAAAQFVTNLAGFFEDSYASIMGNTNLTAAQREAQIVSARALRDRNLNLVRQMYNVDISW